MFFFIDKRYGRGAGVGRAEPIGEGGGVSRGGGVGRRAEVGLGLGVGAHLPVHGVGVAVGVGDAVDVGVGVGVGVDPPIIPLSRNIWSGSPAGLPVQHCLIPQLMQLGQGVGHPGAGQLGGGPKPPAGFCHCAALFAVTVRCVQPHSPPALRVMFA